MIKDIIDNNIKEKHFLIANGLSWKELANKTQENEEQ
jgi:hypothetical protein